jgi:hypothetical protein
MGNRRAPPMRITQSDPEDWPPWGIDYRRRRGFPQRPEDARGGEIDAARTDSGDADPQQGPAVRRRGESTTLGGADSPQRAWARRAEGPRR